MVAGDVEVADELVEEQPAQALRAAAVAGEQRALDHLGQVDQGEDRPVEVGEVPPEDVGLLGGEVLRHVRGHGPSRYLAASAGPRNREASDLVRRNAERRPWRPAPGSVLVRAYSWRRTILPSCSTVLEALEGGRVVVEAEDLVDLDRAGRGRRASVTSANSWYEPIVEPMISICLKNRRGRFSSTFGPRRAAAHHQPPAGLERPHGLLPRRRADALDDHVGLHRPRSVGRVVRGRGAEGERLLALGLAAAGGHDLGAHAPAEGEGGARHAAADADDEHGVARPQPSPAEHAVGREVGQRVGGHSSHVRPPGAATTLRAGATA